MSDREGGEVRERRSMSDRERGEGGLGERRGSTVHSSCAPLQHYLTLYSNTQY